VPTGQTDPCPDPPIAHVPVEGPYKHEFALPDFDDSVTLELEDTFTSLGVDLPTIKSARYVGQTRMMLHAMQNGLDKELCQHHGRFPDLENDDAWAPFPDGYAVVAGTLDFEDEGGTAYSVPFRVRVFLFQNRRDIPVPPSFTYDVMLQPQGKNYEVACQAVHSLKDGEPDRIRIRLGCTRSATHCFRIRWRVSGGRELVSGPIRLKHFLPSRRARQRKKLGQVGQIEEVRSPPSGKRMNCVEESILACMSMSAAAAQRAARQAVLYFAYGSTMHVPRLLTRAKSARAVMPLVIPGFAMRFNKRGADGSAKCNIIKTDKQEDVVAGVVFEVNVEDVPGLDAAEPGYERVRLQVEIQGRQLMLLTYAATGENTAEGLQPWTWYKAHVLQGATAAGLPEQYVEQFIRSVAAVEGVEPPDQQ